MRILHFTPPFFKTQSIFYNISRSTPVELFSSKSNAKFTIQCFLIKKQLTTPFLKKKLTKEKKRRSLLLKIYSNKLT